MAILPSSAVSSILNLHNTAFSWVENSMGPSVISPPIVETELKLIRQYCSEKEQVEYGCNRLKKFSALKIDISLEDSKENFENLAFDFLKLTKQNSQEELHFIQQCCENIEYNDLEKLRFSLYWISKIDEIETNYQKFNQQLLSAIEEAMQVRRTCDLLKTLSTLEPDAKKTNFLKIFKKFNFNFLELLIKNQQKETSFIQQFCKSIEYQDLINLNVFFYFFSPSIDTEKAYYTLKNQLAPIIQKTKVQYGCNLLKTLATLRFNIESQNFLKAFKEFDLNFLELLKGIQEKEKFIKILLKEIEYKDIFKLNTLFAFSPTISKIEVQYYNLNTILSNLIQEALNTQGVQQIHVQEHLKNFTSNFLEIQTQDKIDTISNEAIKAVELTDLVKLRTLKEIKKEKKERLKQQFTQQIEVAPLKKAQQNAIALEHEERTAAIKQKALEESIDQRDEKTKLSFSLYQHKKDIAAREYANQRSQLANYKDQARTKGITPAEQNALNKLEKGLIVLDTALNSPNKHITIDEQIKALENTLRSLQAIWQNVQTVRTKAQVARYQAKKEAAERLKAQQEKKALDAVKKTYASEKAKEEAFRKAQAQASAKLTAQWPDVHQLTADELVTHLTTAFFNARDQFKNREIYPVTFVYIPTFSDSAHFQAESTDTTLVNPSSVNKALPQEETTASHKIKKALKPNDDPIYQYMVAQSLHEHTRTKPIHDLAHSVANSVTAFLFHEGDTLSKDILDYLSDNDLKQIGSTLKNTWKTYFDEANPQFKQNLIQSYKVQLKQLAQLHKMIGKHRSKNETSKSDASPPLSAFQAIQHFLKTCYTVSFDAVMAQLKAILTYLSRLNEKIEVHISSIKKQTTFLKNNINHFFQNKNGSESSLLSRADSGIGLTA